MAARRIRCVCGTVFDPGAYAICPACGNAPSTKPSEQSEPEATTHFREDTSFPKVTRAASRTNEVSEALLQDKKLLYRAVGVVVSVVLLALFVRYFFGGAPAVRTAAHAKVDTDSVQNGSSSPPPSPTEQPRTTVTPEKPARVEPPPPSDVPAFMGTWRRMRADMQAESVIPGMKATGTAIGGVITAAFAGPNHEQLLTVDSNGGYVLDVEVVGEGRFVAKLEEARNLLSVAAQGEIVFSPNGDVNPQATRALLKPVKFDIPHVNVKEDDTELALNPVGGRGGQPFTWFRRADSKIPHTSPLGVWEYAPVFVDSYMPYSATFDLIQGGTYRIHFSRAEDGMLVAAAGSFQMKRTIRMGPPVQGQFQFDGPDRFTLTESRGTSTWERSAAKANRPTGGRPVRGAPKK